MIDYETKKKGELVGFIKAKQLIRKAEKVREEGDPWGSLDLLSEADIEIFRLRGYVEDTKLNILCTETLGQEIVSYKHLFQNEGEDEYRHEYLGYMNSAIEQGLKLDVPEKYKAVFHLRTGDVLTSRGDLVNAEKSYQKAYELVQEQNNHTTAEYLGHLSEAKSDIGQAETAVQLGKLGLQMMKRLKGSVEDWRWLVITSGLHGRLAKCAWKNRNRTLAFTSGTQMFWMSVVLAIRHKKPQRLKQFFLRLRGRGI